MQREPRLKIGSGGVRGVAGESLTPQIIASIAAAFGAYCGPGPILVGTDTRPSGEMVTHAALAGLLSVGSTPVHLGIVPLPSLQFHLRVSDAVGGICISASHNPVEWNGLKFFGADGRILRPGQFSELTDLYHQGVYRRVRSELIRKVQSDDTAISRHLSAVLASVDRELIRSRGLKVALDCCNGAGAVAAPEFLRELGCDLVEVHTDPAGRSPREPEPIAENLTELCRAVREKGAVLGFAQDADADRLAIIDERGLPLGEDCTIALAADRVLARQKGPVVVSLSTSRLIEDVAGRHGCEVYRTAVGEIHVLERMLACGSPVGGEGNGGVILPQLNLCRDSFVAMALVLEALAESGAAVGELRRQWPGYAIVKRRIPCRARDAAAFLRLVRHFYRKDELDLTDGVMVRRPDRWLHIRGSQTEPVLRIIAEAPSEAEAQDLIRHALDYLRPITA